MLGIGEKKGNKQLQEALDTLMGCLEQPYSRKRRAYLYCSENTYMALKALCRHRGVTITDGLNEILRKAIADAYRQDIAAGKLKLNTSTVPVQE
jgi:stalled ribosome rescue protein Dom34